MAARPLFMPGGVLLYALGVLTGRADGSWLAIGLGAGVIALAHTITHYVNEAEDVETDDRTSSPTALTGGSRAIQRGLVTPSGLLRASTVLSAVVLCIVLLELVVGFVLAAVLHLAILGLGYSYSGRPLMLGRRGLGEIVTATVMGALVPIAGALAAGGVTRVTLAVAAILFMSAFLARLSTAYPDMEPDAATGKRTLLVIAGRRRCPHVFLAVAASIAAVGLAAGLWLPQPGWVAAGVIGSATAAACISWLVRSGRARRAPVFVPLVGVGAFGMTLTAMSIAVVAP